MLFVLKINLTKQKASKIPNISLLLLWFCIWFIYLFIFFVSTSSFVWYILRKKADLLYRRLRNLLFVGARTPQFYHTQTSQHNTAHDTTHFDQIIDGAPIPRQAITLERLHRSRSLDARWRDLDVQNFKIILKVMGNIFWIWKIMTFMNYLNYYNNSKMYCITMDIGSMQWLIWSFRTNLIYVHDFWMHNPPTTK